MIYEDEGRSIIADFRSKYEIWIKDIKILGSSLHSIVR